MSWKRLVPMSMLLAVLAVGGISLATPAPVLGGECNDGQGQLCKTHCTVPGCGGCCTQLYYYWVLPPVE